MKRIKRIASLLASIIMCLSLFGCSNASVNNSQSTQPISDASAQPIVKLAPDENADIIVASDIHYLSSSLNDNGELFTKMMDNADGKMTANCDEIVDKFIDTVIESKPACLVLSGDITFNGELQSLKDMSVKLKRVQNAGVPVLVIPGNHDINYPYAYKYEGNERVKTDNISEADFKEVMSDFGYDQAVSRDESTFSYEYAISDSIHLLFLDANTVKYPNYISDDTLGWAIERLKNANENNTNIVTVTHQNILPPSSVLSAGYTINNRYSVLAELERYGVKYNISGHSHIQNTMVSEEFTDICVGSMIVAPLRFDRITITPDGKLDLSLDNVDILQKEASAYFRKVNEAKMKAGLSELQLEPEIEAVMSDFALDINEKIFAGTLTDEDKEHFKSQKGLEYWHDYGGETFWYSYLNTILK